MRKKLVLGAAGIGGGAAYYWFRGSKVRKCERHDQQRHEIVCRVMLGIFEHGMRTMPVLTQYCRNTKILLV
jgi:hypothetical protein